MTKPSAKWCASIALLSLLGAEPAPAGDSAAAGRDAAGEVLSRFGTSEGLRRHTAEPLTAGGTLQTIDGGLTGSAYLTQPSSTAFLTVLVQPGPTGDLILVQASQDLDFSGTADYAFEVPAPVSGVCANGIISCTPGSWLDCEPYRWVAAGTGRVSLESTVLGNLGGCYCINHSCGSGLAWTNLPLILKDLGGGIAGAVQQQKAGYVITHTEIDGPAITYYGQDTSSSGSGGAVPAANHYQSPALLTAAAEDAAMIQAADPDSHYSMIRTSFALRGADQEIRTCSITRVIEAGGPQCSDGVYNASAGKCEVPDWNDGSSYGAVFGFEVEEGKIRIVYRPTSLYGNWAALGTGSQKSTVTYYSYTECYYCDSNGTVCDTDYRNMSIETHGGTDFRIVQEGSSWSRATPWFTIGVDNDGFGHQRINYSSNWIGLSVSGNSLRLHDTWNSNIYAGAWVSKGYDVDPYCSPATETVNDPCASLENDQECSLRKETVDGVTTYEHYNPTHLSPLPGSKVFGDDICAQTFTRNWWQKDREYHCTANSTFSFNDAGQRVNAITASTLANAPGPAIDFSDRRLDPDTGEWLTESGTITLPDLPTIDECRHVCKTRKPAEDTQATATGTTADRLVNVQSWEFYYHTCADQVTCPAGPEEEVLAGCQCLNEFAEATAIMSVLDQAARDMICSDGTRK